MLRDRLLQPRFSNDNNDCCLSQLLGHCLIQLMAFATIVSNKPKSAKQAGVVRGLMQMVGAWVVVVAAAASIQGEIPYLSPPSNANK